jgi:hypothetical protein
MGIAEEPMKIWEYTEDVDTYAHLLFVDQGFTRQLISEFMGKPHTKPWNMPEVAFGREWEAPGLDEEERKVIRNLNEGLPQPDLPWLVGAEPAAVFNERAMQVLGGLLGDGAQILPLSHESQKFYIINIIEIIDCLDVELSEVRHYGPALRIIRPVFKEPCMQDSHIFKIPQSPSAIFVSDRFKQEVETHALKGLTWKS